MGRATRRQNRWRARTSGRWWRTCFPQFFDSVDGVSELLVVKTIYGGAQPVAEAIDSAGWSEVVGTIGGENTVLVICRSREAREKLHTRIERLAAQ